MYRMEYVNDGNKWMIVDVQDRVVFIGSMQQAEDWLDSQENLNRRPSQAGAWVRRVFQGWTRPVGRAIGSIHSRPS
jgi:hypothetical protein